MPYLCLNLRVPISPSLNVTSHRRRGLSALRDCGKCRRRLFEYSRLINQPCGCTQAQTARPQPGKGQPHNAQFISRLQVSGRNSRHVAQRVFEWRRVGFRPNSHSVASSARHTRQFSQPSNSSPCGTCSCGSDGTTQDQGDPCQGSSTTSGSGSGDPGVVTIDNGPGLWTQPDQPDCSMDPTQSGCQVASLLGVPAGKCPQSDLTDSLPVGANIGSVNKNGVTTIRHVIDINQVNAASSFTIVNNVTVVAGWASVGWLYLDDNGGLWFQKDPAAQWTTAYNANINAYFGLSLTPPIAQNPVYVAKPPTSAPINNNLQTTKCFTKGRALTPGTYLG